MAQGSGQTDTTSVIGARSPSYPAVNSGLVKWHASAGVLWLGVALVAGLLYSLQLLQHWPLPKIAVLSPGRIRMVHTNLIAFGFLTNGFLAMLYWTVPRLTGKRVASNALGWLIWVAWNAIILLTWVGLHIGQAQAVEWGETPVWVDPLVVVGAILVWIQFYRPIIKSTEKAMYVSLWYFSAGFVWLGLTYIMGNFFPQYLVAGNAAGPLLGLYIHDLVGLWVTPMGWGMMYFFVPIILRKPIWSHALSLVGFWGLAFFYPLQGVHHFLGSPIPMFAQYSAVISTIAVEIVVATVIINFFMTWKGSESTLKSSIPIRWGDPLHRLGRGSRPPGHVRGLQLLDLRHDRASVAQADRQRVVQHRAAQVALLVHGRRSGHDVPDADGRWAGRRLHGTEPGAAREHSQRAASVLVHTHVERRVDYRRLLLSGPEHGRHGVAVQDRAHRYRVRAVRGRRGKGGRRWNGLASFFSSPG
jgi:hypothetical protein